MSSTKFVFFGSIIIQKRPPWSFCQKGGTLYSGARYVALWASCLCTWAEGSSALLWSHVRRLSSVRPSLTFHIFDFSETADRNSTKLDREARSQWLLQSLCFQTDWKNKMAALVSNYLRHFRLLLWNCWPEFNETDGKQNLNVHWQVCVFGPIGKIRWLPLPLIGWDISTSPLKLRNKIQQKLDRKQGHNVLYQVCVFRADQINKMAALVSDWPRHFLLLLWNRWTEFNEIWQDARSQYPLSNLCFFRPIEKKDGRPGLWLAKTFSTSPLKPLNGIQRNLTGIKISTSSTKFVFSGQSEKQDGCPGLWLSETFSTSPLKLKRNSTKLDRKQNLNVLYQVCVFRVDHYTKTAALVVLTKRWHTVLRCTICCPLGLLFVHLSRGLKCTIMITRPSSVVRPSILNFSHFRLLWDRWPEFNETRQGSKISMTSTKFVFSDRLEKQDGRPGI